MRKIIVFMAVLMILLSTGCIGVDQTGSTPPPRNSNPLQGKLIPSFSATDLNGDVVTESIFAEHSITMINLWGTFCQPCIKEMPDLERLQNKYQNAGVKVVGVVVDKDGPAAKRIVSKTGITYQNVIPDASLEKNVCRAFDYVPVTIFVDKNGRILPELVPGSNNLEGYSQVIDNLLK